MDNSLQIQKLNFQQNANRFMGYGITLSVFYTFFHAPFAFFFVLPLMLWCLSTKLLVSPRCFFQKEKNIYFFDSLTLILLFASSYAIYLVLLNSLGISFLYYSTANLNHINLFLSLISAPIMEEMVFRGFGISIFKQYGKGFSIITTSLLFALLHFGIRVFLVIPSAIMYGIIMIVTKNILFSIIMHMIVNSWLLSFSSFNILAQLFSKNQVEEHWINVPSTLALNSIIVLITLIILWKKPFFKKLLCDCRLSNAIASIKTNKAIYKSFFALNSVKVFLIIATIVSLHNISRAIQELI